jgi:N6-adenosine-specific RNA methylase IME4
MSIVEELKEAQSKYRCIYLDPPWKYNTKPPKCDRPGIEDIYTHGVMSLEEIASLPIFELGHQDRKFCVFLWCTWPKIRDDYHNYVFNAWGLKWVSELVWDKVTIGMGYRFRKRTEVLLVGVPKNSSGTTFLYNSQEDIIVSRKGRHSEKPDAVREMLKFLFPGPRIELFARTLCKGWDSWGLELGSKVFSK